MSAIVEIGIIESRFTEPADPFVMRKEESLIHIHPEFTEGLYDIESNGYLQIIFNFHRAREVRLKGQWYYGGEKGVFACRSPKRPSAIGLTTVELLERNGSTLRVRGLDAIDGTPVLDIKPYIPEVDRAVLDQEVHAFTVQEPRAQIQRMLGMKDLKGLLTEAGALHGHYCPGLSSGVLASFYGLRRLSEHLGLSISALQHADGLEELLAVTEINSCFLDGIQYVSGCTFGNNGLIYRDLGKTAVTFCRRDGKGIRVAARPDAFGIYDRLDPQFSRLFTSVVIDHDRSDPLLKAFRASAAKVGFALLEIPQEELFTFTPVTMGLPDYAAMDSSSICRHCGESVMTHKMVSGSCLSCTQAAYEVLDGSGIHTQERTQ